MANVKPHDELATSTVVTEICSACAVILRMRSKGFGSRKDVKVCA